MGNTQRNHKIRYIKLLRENMKQKKRLAAEILKTSPGKIRFAAGALEDVKKAITRSDMRGLIAVGKITTSADNLHSRAGARRRTLQKRKGLQKGKGSKKGTKYSLVSRKEQWVQRIRAQRELIAQMRDKKLLSSKNYQLLYAKTKGGYFRNRRHIKLYISEHSLLEKKE